MVIDQFKPTPSRAVYLGRKDKVMKDFKVSYEIGDMLHSYIITAENEYNAILKCTLKISHKAQDKFKNFKIERYYEEWN